MRKNVSQTPALEVKIRPGDAVGEFIAVLAGSSIRWLRALGKHSVPGSDPNRQGGYSSSRSIVVH